MSRKNPTDLVIVLAHELSCSLEVQFEPHEIKHLWPEAFEALETAAVYLKEQGLPVPQNIQEVIDRVRKAG